MCEREFGRRLTREGLPIRLHLKGFLRHTHTQPGYEPTHTREKGRDQAHEVR